MFNIRLFLFFRALFIYLFYLFCDLQPLLKNIIATSETVITDMVTTWKQGTNITEHQK